MLRSKWKFGAKAGIVYLMAAGLLLTGCANTKGNATDKTDTAATNVPQEEGGKRKVVTTIFPYYDFVRQVGGDYVDVSLIVPAGMDTHSFEPTAADMVTIGEADLLIYNGGEQETWVSKVIDASGNENLFADSMLNYVDTDVSHVDDLLEDDRDDHTDADDLLEDDRNDYDDADDLLERDTDALGDTDDDYHDHDHNTDEHIWTSPENAQEIVVQIAKDLAKTDPSHKEQYMENAQQYNKKLEQLDQKFEKVVAQATNRYLVFGDRFPLKHFVDEYDLGYDAAFDGCGTETEPSADTIARLTDEVKKRNIPVVLKIELTSSKVADSIAEATGARVETFNTCHNVTKEQFEAGETYLSLMEENVSVLKDALGVK